MGHFWDQNQHLNFSLNLFARFSWNCSWRSGIKKWLKVTVLDFYGTFLLCLKWGIWGIFRGQKSNFLNFFVNLFINFYWNYTYWNYTKSVHQIFWQFYLMTSIDNGVKVTLFIFQYNFAYVQRISLWTFSDKRLTCFRFLVPLLCFIWEFYYFDFVLLYVNKIFL